MPQWHTQCPFLLSASVILKSPSLAFTMFPLGVQRRKVFQFDHTLFKVAEFSGCALKYWTQAHFFVYLSLQFSCSLAAFVHQLQISMPLYECYRSLHRGTTEGVKHLLQCDRVCHENERVKTWFFTVTSCPKGSAWFSNRGMLYWWPKSALYSLINKILENLYQASVTW